MKTAFLLPILVLSAYSASSQPTNTKPVVLSVAQAAKVEDSLRVLPLVRQEASQWRAASRTYQQAADSLRRAIVLQQGISQSYQQSLAEQTRLTTSATADATEWRSKARKRGVINGLLLAAAGVLGYVGLR